jgi:hypothetical protein
MAFVTFSYRFANNKKRIYTGKCFFERISDDHEGLDKEVLRYLVKGLNSYRQSQNIAKKVKSKDLMVGVLGVSSDIYVPSFSSKKERKFFDFYYIQYEYNDNTDCEEDRQHENLFFVNGKRV